MRLHKSKWFYILVAELEKREFTRGGTGCPGISSSYCRNGVTVELRGAHMLRVLRPGHEREYRHLDLATAIKIIDQAARNAG